MDEKTALETAKAIADKTKVRIASNDTQILLQYHVYNPHYKAAVNPKYH